MHSRSQISVFNDTVSAVVTGIDPLVERFRLNAGSPQGALRTPERPAFDEIRVFRGQLPIAVERELHELEAGSCATPFQARPWVADWQAVQAKTSGLGEPVTVLGYRDGKPNIALNLALHSNVLASCLTWQCHGLSDYGAPVASPEVLAWLDPVEARALLVKAGQDLGGVDLIYLSKTPALLGDVANPFVQSDSRDFYAGAHAIRMEGPWQEFYEAHRSARTRQSLRRKAKALEQLGKVEFRLARTPAEGKEIVAAALDMKCRQLAISGHANPFVHRATREFLLRHFSGNLGASTWAAALELNGEKIASAFGFRGAGQWLVYQFSMTEGSEARFSPGIHLLVHIMQRCMESGAGRLDLSLGDEPYKLEWCNEHSPLKTTVLALSATGRLCRRLIGARAVVSAWLAQHPTRYRLAKKLKPKLARLGIHA